jgi:hypothetical protein
LFFIWGWVELNFFSLGVGSYRFFSYFFLYGKEEIHLWDFFYIIRKLNYDNYFLFEVGLSCCHQDPIELGSARQQDQLSLGSATQLDPTTFGLLGHQTQCYWVWLFCQMQGSWVWFGRQTQCYRVHFCS